MPPRALIIDDNMDAAQALGFLVEELGLGYQVAYAANGNEALRALSLQRPHILLLDIGMPGLDGWEVAKKVRADPALCSITMVAVTGYASAADQQKSTEAGIDHHFAKPASFEVLEPILRHVAAEVTGRRT